MGDMDRQHTTLHSHRKRRFPSYPKRVLHKWLANYYISYMSVEFSFQQIEREHQLKDGKYRSQQRRETCVPHHQHGGILSEATRRSFFLLHSVSTHNSFPNFYLWGLKDNYSFIQCKYKAGSLLTSELGKNIFYVSYIVHRFRFQEIPLYIK